MNIKTNKKWIFFYDKENLIEYIDYGNKIINDLRISLTRLFEEAYKGKDNINQKYIIKIFYKIEEVPIEEEKENLISNETNIIEIEEDKDT